MTTIRIKVVDRKAATEAQLRAKVKRLEQVVKAAAEFEYREHMNYQTYTNKTAAEMAQKRRDEALNELRLVLRDTGLVKRD